MAAKDIELDPEQANERDRQKLLEQAGEIERGAETAADAEDPEVEVEGPGGDEEEDDLDTAAEETPRPSRAERRGNRFSEAQRAREEAQRALEEERARRIALEVQLQTARAPQQPPESREQQAAAAERWYREQLDGVQQQRLEIQTFIVSRGEHLTNEERQRMLEYETNLRIHEAKVQRQFNSRMDEIERPPPAPQNPLFDMMRARYRDVDSSALGRQYFVTHVMEQKHQNPTRNEEEVLEEAFQKARALLKGEPWSPAVRSRAKPTAQQRAKFTGTGAGSASNGPPSQRPSISEHEDKMAQKLYAHIQDPKERRRLYYKNVKLKKPA